MEFCILGPLEVRAHGKAVALGATKQRAVLLLLLLRANEIVGSERLVDDLWGERAPRTAAHAVQVYVSNLRRLFAEAEEGGADRLVTRPPGYLLRVEPGELDLERFERRLAEGRRALADGAPAEAAAELRKALALWRGSPLVEFAYDLFAQASIARLEELRLIATEEWIEAELAGDRSGDVVGTLEGLIAEHPLRERLRGQLMLALYRSGRQGEALEVFAQTRRVLVDELGIEPTPKLQQLERAILQQDPQLDAIPAARGAGPTPSRGAESRSILLSVPDVDGFDRLQPLVGPLAVSPAPHALIVVQLAPPAELSDAAAALEKRRSRLVSEGAEARVATFISRHPGHDLIRFASHEEVDLLLVSTERGELTSGALTDELTVLFASAPCDVALVVADVPHADVRTVLVPFGGGEHDWAALELAAWFAGAHRAGLRIAGTLGPDGDASRLLAHAALAVQLLVAVPTEPVLLEPGTDGLLAAAADASLLVLGAGETWKRDGLGGTRAALVSRAPVPLVVVRSGLRPGGLAPNEDLTRFTWSLGVSG